MFEHDGDVVLSSKTFGLETTAAGGELELNRSQYAAH